MPWFWGRKADEDDEDDEYDSEDEYSDDDGGDDEEEYESEEDDNDELEEESYEEVEDEEVEDEEVAERDMKRSPADATLSDANMPESTTEEEKPDNDNEETAMETKNPLKGSSLKNKTDVTNGSNADKGYIHEFEDDDDDNDTDEENNEVRMERIESGVPDQVMGNRHRAPSALTLGETDDEEGSNGSIMDESTHSEISQEQDDHVTTMAEKQSLLVLAAEHDRVDILNSVLSEITDKEELLHGGIPPLHIAILNGSINTATCLLRMGADPSVRPNVKEIAQNQDPSAPMDVPKQIDGVTAWELAFDTKIVSKAKQQGLMNAFSAEALRCMGSDEGTRLQQLLEAGMPSDMPIMGDKSLYDWAVELGAPQCEEVLRPTQAAKHSTNDSTPDDATGPMTATVSGGKSAVLDRPGSDDTAEKMTRHLEELESLAKALSTCLDSLAEEVSVSHGLLLMGGGATALASHVRSLKALKEQKTQELSRHQEAFENTQDELEYWINKAGHRGQVIANEEAPVSLSLGSRRHVVPPKFSSAAEENAYCEKLHQKITATDEKIRKFRVSIADLSEENDRNMQEVEKRGLTGGINLVRGLKDEIREIEFSLEETKVADSVYRAKVEKIQSVLNSKDFADEDSNGPTGEDISVAGTSRASTEHHFNHAKRHDTSKNEEAQENDSFSDGASDQFGDMKPSERIASGHSTALTVRSGVVGPGSFPLSLWQILLRIIGLRDHESPTPPPRRQSSGSFTSSAQPAMII